MRTGTNNEKIKAVHEVRQWAKDIGGDRDEAEMTERVRSPDGTLTEKSVILRRKRLQINPESSESPESPEETTHEPLALPAPSDEPDEFDESDDE